MLIGVSWIQNENFVFNYFSELQIDHSLEAQS